MVYKALQKFSFTLFPPTCILCGMDGQPEWDLCYHCRHDLPLLKQGCDRCGLPLTAVEHAGAIWCGACLRRPPSFDEVRAPLRYQQPVDWMVQQLKYHARFSHIQVLGRMLSEHLSRTVHEWPDLIIPVPLHRRRLCERGFNQALELSRYLAKRWHLPLADALCERRKDTVQQSTLPSSQRIANLRNAFVMRDTLTVKHVAIVDDVVTTGATVNALARLLKDNGADRVQVWAIARTVSNK